MAKIIRKYLVVLLTGCLPKNGAFGIEFSPNGREIFTGFATKEPTELTLTWNNRIFLRRGTHTTRRLIENDTIWLTMLITRYVEIDCADLDLILEEKPPEENPKTRHQPKNNSYAAVLSDKDRGRVESYILPNIDD